MAVTYGRSSGPLGPKVGADRYPGQLPVARGTAAEWAAENPVLAAGHLGLETDTKVLKVGDGITAWAALGAAVSPTVSAPGYRSQSYYAPAGSATSTRNFGGDGELRLVPFRVRSQQAFERLSVEVTTAGGAGTLFRVGIWNHNPASGRPGALLLDAGTVPGDVVQVSQAAIAVTLPAGVVWLGIAPQSTAGSPVVRGFTGGLEPMETLTTGAIAASNSYFTTGVTGALGDLTSATLQLAQTAPALMMRAA